MQPQQVAEFFAEALREALSTMAMMEFELEAIEPASSVALCTELAARVELSDRGMLLLAVSPRLAPRIAAAMLGMEPGEVGTEEASDIVAELSNMIAGGARRALAETEYVFTFSLPTRILAEPGMLLPPHVPGAIVRGSVAGDPILLGVWLEAGK